MKKILGISLSLALVISLLAGCGTTAKKPAGDEAAKTGLAVSIALGSSKNAGEEDGLAQIDATVVAVLVGKDGKILDCKIDAVQTKVNFSKEGKLLTDVASTFKTKQELGAEYGMIKGSGIGKEWNEQANAFAAYCVGKTADEVKGIALTEGKPADADLAASVTMHVTDYIATVAKAVANAQDLGAAKGDKLGLSISTDIGNSKDASADGEGLAQAYSYYTATTFGSDNKITSCILDASQGNVNFGADGVITTDLTAAPQTKQEIKEGYNMKSSSKIGKEWYEQANAFAAYCVGKTVDQVKGIALTEGKPSDADLAASVTVHVNAFMAGIENAYNNAK